ncbi:MAG: universal stress protein [Jatrophihabitans sp.]
MTTAESTAPRIVVGVDGSEGSKDALRWAKRIADATGSGIDAVSAWEFTSTYGWSGLPPYAPLLDVEKALTDTVDEVFGSERPKDLELHARQGSPAGVLIEASGRAQMVVVGSRGRGGFTGMLLGSVSAKVVEHAQCPVTVVHSPKASA